MKFKDFDIKVGDGVSIDYPGLLGEGLVVEDVYLIERRINGTSHDFVDVVVEVDKESKVLRLFDHAAFLCTTLGTLFEEQDRKDIIADCKTRQINVADQLFKRDLMTPYSCRVTGKNAYSMELWDFDGESRACFIEERPGSVTVRVGQPLPLEFIRFL